MDAIDTYRNLSGQRAIFAVRISKHGDSRLGIRSHTVREARYAILEDCNGVEFNARIPMFGITAEGFRNVSAKIHHVDNEGRVYLQNVRLCGTQRRR